jgi:hypothetical protein
MHKTIANNRLSIIGRLLRRVFGGLGLGLGLTLTSFSFAQTLSGQTVPQHWISYAQLASNQFEERLSDPSSEVVVRLHNWMQERILNQTQPMPASPLVVHVWVASSGQVSRLEFESLGQAQADDDLRTILTSEALSEPPPRDMRQPMVLQLTLSFVTRN